MKSIRSLFALVLPLLIVSCSTAPVVQTGADAFMKGHLSHVQGKRLGIVTNHTALLSDGRHFVDALKEAPGVSIVALFGPEHGIRGDAPDGDAIRDSADAKTGIHVYSLYGTTNKPTPDMLKDVDMLLFDIQDVGARFYTYTSTLSLAMEAAAEKGIPFVVIDRPNPIRGTWVDGFVRLDSLASFVGLHPTPIAHGMTVGELATMINEEGWLANGVRADLRIVKCEGWDRSMWYDQTGLTWVRPSPNMPFVSTAAVYPGMCLFEGTNLSEGRGTEKPFEYIGAPYLSGQAWAKELNALGLTGVTFEPISFTPESIPNVTSNPKYRGVACEGVFVKVTDRDQFDPIKTFLHMITAVKKGYPQQFEWRQRGIDRLAGTPILRLSVDEGKGAEEIAAMWKAELETFKKIREKYLLY